MSKQERKALGYIQRIKNDRKRHYAERHLAFMLRGSVGLNPCTAGLSMMAAQAVRLRLSEILQTA